MTDSLSRVFETSWPAAEYRNIGGFRVGRGAGGGGRVSGASAVGDWMAAQIADVEKTHAEWGQQSRFLVCDDQADLAATLTERGYEAVTPTVILQADTASLADVDIPPVTCFSLWPPLAIQRDLWSESQIGPARQAVMDRVTLPRAALLGRTSDRAAGVGFVAADGDVAMVHALAVLSEWRRAGLGRWMVHGAAQWARDQGAASLALAVERSNHPALAMYRRLGFVEIRGYRYFLKGPATQS